MIIKSVADSFLLQELSNLKSQLFTGKLSIKEESGQQWYSNSKFGNYLETPYLLALAPALSQSWGEAARAPRIPEGLARQDRG